MVLSRLDLRAPDADMARALPSATADPGPLDAVREILADVRARGDAALLELTERFDGCILDEPRVPSEDLETAWESIPDDVRAALSYAAGRIDSYHQAQAAGEGPVALDVDGISVEDRIVPVGRAGLYVPGGRAAYPSTVLMTAIPARIAGVAEIALCVPADRAGNVPAVTLAAARLAGVDEVYRVGGAQAIAAMAYGTETIRPVDVIVGPGNVYVSLAKREVAEVVGIPSTAGPSELVVVADASAPAEFVAADLAAQAEHGPGGTAVLVAWDPEVIDAVDDALRSLVADANRAEEIITTLQYGGRAVLVRDATQALEVANYIAPEHLELMTADAEVLLPAVRNAGAVFCGAFSATALGDYVAGASHVLPTGRGARFASALRVGDFRKHMHVVRATPEGISIGGAHAAVLAAAEGLDTHAWSLIVRERP